MTIAPSTALLHCQKALAGLSSAVSAGDAVTAIELEAQTYVSLALLFQTVYMTDAFSDYFTF